MDAEDLESETAGASASELVPALTRPQVQLLVSEDSLQPVVISFTGLEIECALVRRDCFEKRVGLDPLTWGVAGVYVLIGPAGDLSEADIWARAGKTGAAAGGGDLLKRIDAHASGADALDWWTRVLLVRRGGNPFDSAEAGFLEGELHRLLGEARRVKRIGSPNYDGSLPEYRQQDLRRLVSGLAATLETLGVVLATDDDLQRLSSLASGRRG